MKATTRTVGPAQPTPPAVADAGAVTADNQSVAGEEDPGAALTQAPVAQANRTAPGARPVPKRDRRP